MESFSETSKAKAVLLAVNFTVDTDITALRRLWSLIPAKVPVEVMLRILLTYLPESTEPAQYIPLLQDLDSGPQKDAEDRTFDASSVEGFSEDEARRRVRKLRLLPLRDSSSTLPEASDPMTAFLVHRVRRIDLQSGVLSLALPLISPFLDRSRDLRIWHISNLLPVLRHNYEFYPHASSNIALADLEARDDSSAVSLLLSDAKVGVDGGPGKGNIMARDIRGLVGPWVYGDGERKRRKMRHAPLTMEALSEKLSTTVDEDVLADGIDRAYQLAWLTTFRWLLTTATEDHDIVLQAIDAWEGPRDVDLGGYDDGMPGLSDTGVANLNSEYAQCALAVLYAAPTISEPMLIGMNGILSRLSELVLGHGIADLQSTLETSPVLNLDMADLIRSTPRSLSTETALDPDNPFTKPTETSLTFLQAILLSSMCLNRWHCENGIKALALLCVYATEETQNEWLVRCIRSLTAQPNLDNRRWMNIRTKLLWLWRWGQSSATADQLNPSSVSGLFGRVSRAFLETEVLKALLLGMHHQAIIDIYLSPSRRKVHLSQEQLEQAIWDVAMKFYDNATNCDRARGGMKKSSDTINAFYPEYFPRSVRLDQAGRLLSATHSLSSYSLTLQRGVPFRPVNIRVHQDPIGLLGKVLEQNRRGYTELDDLLEIGRNLVRAGLVSTKAEHSANDDLRPSDSGVLARVERRVASMAIDAALAENDLETAHRYVLDRLPVHSDVEDRHPGALLETNGRSRLGAGDDTSWRAAFQAGRHRPSASASGSFSGAYSDMHRLEMRVELLSHALLLAPATSLSGILTAWRQCEEELDEAVTNDAEEAQRWDDKANPRLSGQFVNNTNTNAHSKRTQPVSSTDEGGPIGLFDVARGAAAALSKTAFPLRAVAAGAQGMAVNETDDGGDEGQRVRKRDQVSNLVTTGLASGIGWVLGATPTPPKVGSSS